MFPSSDSRKQRAFDDDLYAAVGAGASDNIDLSEAVSVTQVHSSEQSASSTSTDNSGLQTEENGIQFVLNGYVIEPGADLSGADLHGANLLDADLRGANLVGANLLDANLRGIYHLETQQSLEATTGLAFASIHFPVCLWLCPNTRLWSLHCSLELVCRALDLLPYVPMQSLHAVEHVYAAHDLELPFEIALERYCNALVRH